VTIWRFFGAAVATAVAAQTPAFAQQGGLERVSWLAGCWEQRGPDRLTTEMWMAPFGGTMMGSSRTVMGGTTREFEHLRISARGDTIVYTALPSGQKQTDFKSTTVAPTSIVFENRTHDFPQVISYRRVGADSLVARIEGPGPNNTTRGTNFPMKRASCTDVPAPPPPPDTTMVDAEPSPDGKQFVLVRGAGNWELFLTDANVGNRRQLTNHSAVDYMPAWSPDASRIAFVSVRSGHQEIYTIRPDGSELVQLTQGTAHNSEPVWSPDGKSIAFRSERERKPRVYLMNADGSGQRALTQDTFPATTPSWSPDGRQILYASPRSGHTEIHVMNADGSDARQLTTTTVGHSSVPMWSKGGTIVFWTTRDGNDEVYAMNADGSNARNLTNSPARDVPVALSRDGAYVYIRSTRDRAQNDIYRMKVDGGEVVRVTTTK
jgi:TolB protein